MAEVVEWDAPEETLSFDDSDHFEEDSLCSWMSEPESLCRNWRGWQTQFSNSGNVSELRNDKSPSSKVKEGEVPSLIELSAQTVALQLPFEHVERFPVPIPENLQLRIAFWSFPESEDDIRLYSCLANGNADEFQKGEHLVKSNCIIDIMQIGFHLSATVHLPPTSINKGSCLVAVTFDRQRITSCACNCESNAKWCSHVVALCLARIQRPGTVCLRAPVSESLSRLQRDQLQKFAQYLISELPQQILPTAQRLLDELLASSSTAINEEAGAPDPTAGPSLSDISIWCLDEQALTDNIKKTLVKFCGPSPIVYSDVNSLYLSSTEPPAASEYSSLLRPLRGREPEGIWNLLSIVREMLRRRDGNAVLLLDIVTEQCLSFEQVAVWWYNTCTSVAHLHSGNGQHGSHRPANNINSEIAQHAAASLCDEIVSLWRLVLLSPSLRKFRKRELKVRLGHWHGKTLNIIKRGKYKESHLCLFPGFKEAIKTCDFDWDGGSCISMCRHIICTCGNSTSPIHSDNEFAGPPTKKYFVTKNDQKIIMTVYRQELDYLFSRAESLYVHGFISQASDMAVRLANELLSNPENLVSETSPEQASNGDWIKSCTEYAFKTFNRVVFLCHVLSENPAHRLLAFQVGLYGLQFERLPASSKAMEVKLFHKQLQITTIMKKLPLAAQEIAILREKAQCLINYEDNGNSLTPIGPGGNHSNVQHVLPLYLAMFVFDALCQQNKGSNGKERKYNSSSKSYSSENEMAENDQELGFMASVTALGYKLNVSEAEHPLLCEGTRRQKGDLAVMLLVQFKNAHSKIKMILDKLLDKSLALNLQATSAFTGDSVSGPSSSGVSYAYRKKVNTTASSACPTPSCSVSKSPQTHPKPLDKVVTAGPPFKYCSVCKTSFVHRSAYQNVHDSNSSTQADDSSEEEDSNSRSASIRDDTDATMAAVLHNQMRIDSGNEDIKSSSCDEEYPINVCSPQKRDGKTSWRSPTVRPKRRQHCIANVNSSASEEAMLSDTSPRLTRRGTANLALLPSATMGLPNNGLNNKTPTSSSVWPSRYPASPSSDSSSNHSIKSDDLESNDVMDKPGASNQNMHVPASSTPPISQVPPQQNSAISGSGGKGRSGNNFRMKNRGRNTICVPDVPNQPSEASAHFFFELAKTVLVKAGGNSSTSLFMQPQSSSQSGVNRNLLLAAFEIGLYALGMHNCVSPNWLSRTYSSHVSWISGQAMEIGSASLQILVDSWEGHLTPTETVSLADRASHGRDPTTVQVAAELALSVLPYAHAVNPNEVHRALYQCRDQGPEMLEKANIAVEHAGKSGGVHPEVLFAVAKQWQWLHENEMQGQRNNSPQQPVPASVASIPQQTYAVPIPAGAPNVAASVTGMVLHPTNVVTFQSDNTVRPHPPVGLAVHPSNMAQPVTLIPQTVTQPQLLHPSAGFPTAPIVTQAPVPSRSQLPVLDTQYTSNGGSNHHVVTQHLLPNCSTIQHSHHTYNPTPIHHHAAGINLLPMQHSNRIHALQYCTASGTFLADPLSHAHQHHTGHQSMPLATAIAPIPANTLPLHNHASTYRLQSAFRVGMLAMDLLAKRTEERPNSKYAKNPPYAQNVKWLLKLSIELGGHCVQQFCLAAITAIHSPFLLQDIAVDTAQYLAMNNHQQACSNLRLPFVQPVIQKCVQMYIQFIHNRLYHLHHSDYDEFATLVQNSRTAFLMTPGGLMQFNEVVQSIRRSKSCKKELWQKIVAGLAMPPTSV